MIHTMKTTRRIAALALTLLMLLAPCAFSHAALIVSHPRTSITEYSASRPQYLDNTNLYAQSVILIDVDTGRVLFSKHASEKLYPASMTKIMTAMLAIENLELDQTVTISKTVASIGESSIYLFEGEEITVRDLLYGMLLKSGNAYAGALAEAVAGNLKDFAVMMTNRAKELGCTETNFANPHGLTNENHYTTAQDFAKIIREACQNPTLCEIIGTYRYEIAPTNKNEKKRVLINTNKMLPENEEGFAYEYCTGGKTGYTDAAKHTFFGLAEKDGVRLACVLMGTTQDGKWEDTKKLMEFGFASFQRISLKDIYSVAPFSATVSGAEENDSGVLELVIPEDVDPAKLYMLVSSSEKDDITANFQQYASVSVSGNPVAPVQKGQQMGKLIFTYGDWEPVELPLVASRTIATPIISVTPVPTESAVVKASSGVFVTTDGRRDFSPLILLVILPALAFIGLLVWLFVEMRTLKSERNAKKRRARELAIRKKYEEERKQKRGPIDDEVYIRLEEGKPAEPMSERIELAKKSRRPGQPTRRGEEPPPQQTQRSSRVRTLSQDERYARARQEQRTSRPTQRRPEPPRQPPPRGFDPRDRRR